jgi:hypothetical protein
MKPKFEIAGIGEALFEGVSSGKITTEEYKIAIKGLNIIKKIL